MLLYIEGKIAKVEDTVKTASCTWMKNKRFGDPTVCKVWEQCLAVTYAELLHCFWLMTSCSMMSCTFHGRGRGQAGGTILIRPFLDYHFMEGLDRETIRYSIT